jgi:hypothetical protein
MFWVKYTGETYSQSGLEKGMCYWVHDVSYGEQNIVYFLLYTGKDWYKVSSEFLVPIGDYIYNDKYNA